MFVFVILSSLFLAACWERADLLAHLCVMFSGGVSSQVWYMIVSIPDLCLLFYFFTFENTLTKQISSEIYTP